MNGYCPSEHACLLTASSKMPQWVSRIVSQNTIKARAGVGIVLIKDAIGSDPKNRKGARSYDTVANQSAMHAVAAADDSVRLREVRENCYQAVERDCISVVAKLLSITANDSRRLRPTKRSLLL